MCRAILWSLQPCCRRRMPLASSNATGGLPPLDRGTVVDWISLGCWPVFNGESARVFPRTNLRMLEISNFSIVFLIFKRKIARACFDWVLLDTRTGFYASNNPEWPPPRQVVDTKRANNPTPIVMMECTKRPYRDVIIGARLFSGEESVSLSVFDLSLLSFPHLSVGESEKRCVSRVVKKH